MGVVILQRLHIIITVTDLSLVSILAAEAKTVYTKSTIAETVEGMNIIELKGVANYQKPSENKKRLLICCNQVYIFSIDQVLCKLSYLLRLVLNINHCYFQNLEEILSIFIHSCQIAMSCTFDLVHIQRLNSADIIYLLVFNIYNLLFTANSYFMEC